VFYDKGSYSDGWRYLEAAPTDEGTYCGGGYDTFLGTTGTAIGTGEANTAAIVDAMGNGSAVEACTSKTTGGYSDWFLPSKDELHEMYRQKSVIGGFITGGYWSSSESRRGFSWGENFDNGSQGGYNRSYNSYVRAIRAF